MLKPESLHRPVLQPTMVRQAESFVCRRCRTNNATSHESFDSPYHFHPEIEIILIENSRGTRYVADSVEPYEPGEIVVLGPSLPHVFVRAEAEAGKGRKPETSVVLHFRANFMGEAFMETPEMLEVRQLLSAASHGLHYAPGAAPGAVTRLKRLVELQGLRRLTALLELLDILTRAPRRPLMSGAFERKIPLKDLDRLDRVLVYLTENFHKQITLSSAARVAALGPTSFSHWFRRATSKSFVECLTEIRLGHAYRLLAETGKNVTEISFDCGFNSVSHFIHRFQQMRGMSPSEFRHLARTGLGNE